MAKKSNKTRADGRIAVQVYIGKVDGKRKYKTVYGATQKEADAAADEIKQKLRKGFDLSANNNTFKYWAEAWLAHKKDNDTPAWHSVCKARAQYWIDALGSYQIDKINMRDLELVMQRLSHKNPRTGKPTAKKTLTEIKNIAEAIFNYAIQNRIIDFNPAQFLVVARNAPKSERRALTDEEIEWIKNTPHKLQTACMIMLFAGLRRGEVGALTWNDIDFENHTITVNKAADIKNPDGPKTKGPKTKAGYRTVTLCDILCDYLKDLPRNDLLVCSNNGRMLTEGNWTYLWKNYLDTLNDKYGDFKKVFIPEDGEKPFVINRFTAHCLRHTFCTLLNESGINIVTAKEYMGHSDIHTTLQIYSHSRNENPDLPRNQLNEYLQKNKAKKESASQDASQQ